MVMAYSMLKGFEVIQALKKDQAELWQYGSGVMAEMRLIERNFRVYAA